MDVFDLVAKIRLDTSEYEGGLDKARGGFSNLASGVGKGLLTVGKIGATAVAAGAAGVAALTKMGVQSYAQYEQLKGGVETIFKESSDAVMKYAENAYKTSGLSANQYMQTVTSFSASLIQSLGGDTEKAAKVADVAITDMSDNANKFGTDIGMLQNAYQGFSKGNFMMLDNLKLGYGGTKSEMERLLADAEKLPEAMGRDFDLSNYADIVEAIHLVQENMGIAGATAQEAATTIEGSIGMMKGAWENLIVGMADENANMEELVNNFVDSAATAANNLLPRIEQTLLGIGKLIEKLAPIIAEALPLVIESVLPTLIVAGMQLISAIVNGLITAAPAIYEALLDALFIALTTVFGMSEESAGEFVNKLDSIIRGTVDFIKTGLSLIKSLMSGLYNGFVEILGAVGGWMTDNIVNPIANFGTSLYDIGANLLNNLWDGMKSIWGKVKSWWDGLTFSEKKAPVSGGGNSHATGLNYVPFDGYPAILHRGEAVLTSAEASVWRKGGATPAMAGAGITINQYIQSVAQTPVQLASATEAYFEQARWML